MKFDEIIKNKSEYRLGFLGGSITEGCGASILSKRYSSVFTQLMNKRYPDKNFIEINGGIGGTPSPFGMFRLKHDILDQNPDMLFIEFAVNDAGANYNSYMEGIIRAARRYNPNMPIMILISHCSKFLNTTRDNPHNSVRNHIEVAKSYNIPYVLMGYDMLERITDFGGNDRFFTVDGGHPNDDGYRLYADSMMKAITYSEFSFDPIPEQPIFGNEYNNPDLILCSDLKLSNGWKLSEMKTWSTNLHYIYSCTPGAELKFSFEGTDLGWFFMFDKDGGEATIKIDGKHYGNIVCFNKNCLQHDCFTNITIPFGKHDVIITMSDEKDPLSEGATVRIAAFCIG